MFWSLFLLENIVVFSILPLSIAWLLMIHCSKRCAFAVNTAQIIILNNK